MQFSVSNSLRPRGTIAYQAPLSMGFSRQDYWSGLPFPSPGDLPDPGMEHGFPALQAGALTSEPPGGKLNQIQFYPGPWTWNRSLWVLCPCSVTDCVLEKLT